MNIQGQAALVTGGASGLGEATARELARLGAKVAVLDVNLAQAEKVAAEIDGIACQCDITNTESLQAALAKAADRHGPARILMNIAGIGTAKRVVQKDGSPAPLEDFARVVNINLVGTYNASRLFAANARSSRRWRTASAASCSSPPSVAAFDGQVGQQAYSAVQGRAGRHDAADGARPRAARHPRVHRRARPVRHAADEAAARSRCRRRWPPPFPSQPRLGKPEEFAQLACHIVTTPT
jgi:NAD(P)-dependent dehydrogenase (short-subunit alcohol dehydrogenase family)